VADDNILNACVLEHCAGDLTGESAAVLIGHILCADCYVCALDSLDYGNDVDRGYAVDDIDIIIPLPLHPIKSIKRGYNQSRYLADGIAKELGVEVESRAVRRTRNNPSQARLKRRERWEGVDDLFSVVKPERLRGKHILVVDDVMTSGATLYSCMQTILAAVPDARISFATLAVTGHITPL
jgi:predicted amidophosphoribosyltransferase